MKMLQFADNGGPCPFFWQEFRIFQGHSLAGSCRRAGGTKLPILTVAFRG